MINSIWITEGPAILFSALLVYFAKKQRDINKEQKDLNEYQNSSILRIEDWEYVESHEHDSDGVTQPDLLELTCSNYGEAPAFDIRAQLYVYGDDIGGRVDNLTFKKDIGGVVEDLNNNYVKYLGLNGEGAAIGSDERDVKITGSVGFEPKMFEDKYGLDFGDKSSLLKPLELCEHLIENTHEDELKVGIAAWYKDGTGKRGPIYLQFVTVNADKIEMFHGMRELFEKSRPLPAEEIPGEVDSWWKR